MSKKSEINTDWRWMVKDFFQAIGFILGVIITLAIAAVCPTIGLPLTIGVIAVGFSENW